MTDVCDGCACPSCGQAVSRVFDSRPTTWNGIATVRRRRVCRCGNRWSTYELERETADDLHECKTILETVAHSAAAKTARPKGEAA